MWPFSKPKKPDPQAEARKAVDELRSEFLDETLIKGMLLNDRLDRLSSVQPAYFTELLGLTEDTADRIFQIYERHPDINSLEIHGFCASTVAAAVHVSKLLKDEKPTVIDIYLDLWVDGTVRQAPSLDAKILKGSIDRMWRGLLPALMRAAAEEEAIKLGFPDPSGTLLAELDRLLNVNRPDVEKPTAAFQVKAAVVDAVSSRMK